MLKMSYVKPEFLCADVIVENPMVWFIEIDSLPVDAGSLARPANSGIRTSYIPYILAFGPDGTAALMQR